MCVCVCARKKERKSVCRERVCVCVSGCIRVVEMSEVSY